MKELTEEQKAHQEKYGHEYYYEPHTDQMEFSQVRTNMMKDPNYVPYCIPCPGLQRYKRTNVIGTIKCPNCSRTETYPKDFIDRFKAKHNL